MKRKTIMAGGLIGLFAIFIMAGLGSTCKISLKPDENNFAEITCSIQNYIMLTEKPQWCNL